MTGTETCLQDPPRPADLGATAVSSSSVRLTWTFASTATSYTIFDGDAVIATTYNSSFMVTGLAPASAHRFRVSATLAQSCGESPPSRRADAATPQGPAARLAAPASLTVTGNTPGSWPSGAQVTLSWTPAAGADPVTYRVYEGAAVVGETSATGFTFGVGAGTTHEYVVVAVDAAGNESATSPAVTVRAMYLPPP
jgi:hypothetical protein